MADDSKGGMPIPANYCISCEGDHCPPDCDNVFEMVHVSYLIRGGSRIMYQLIPEFHDRLPWEFQLQVGSTGSNDSNDWENVGLPVENTCYAIDPEKRVYNKSQGTHYRVRLNTPDGTYYSDPIEKGGILGVRDWRLAREIVRKERLRLRYTSQDGYLIKRRSTGEDCRTCLDLQTNEVTDPYCPECWGTGKQCGYYYPMACIWVDMDPRTGRRHVDDQAVRGTINDITVKGRMLMLPLIDELDVWVSRKTDDRYFIHTVQSIAEVRGVPLIASVELRPAPFTDVIYEIPIPQQDAWLQQHC